MDNPPPPSPTDPFPPTANFRRLRVWPWVLVAVVVVFAVAIAMLTVVVTFLASSAREPRQAGEKFLEAVADGRVEEAYSMMCQSAQRDLDADQFAALITPSPRITSIDLSTLNHRYEDRISLVGQIEVASPKTGTATVVSILIEVSKQDNQRQICQWQLHSEAFAEFGPAASAPLTPGSDPGAGLGTGLRTGAGD